MVAIGARSDWRRQSLRRSAVALALAAVDLAAVVPRVAGQPVFRAAVQGIRVDVLVMAGARPVAGLGPADFELRDNGVPQTIEVAPRAETPIRVILAVDTSRSVEGRRLEAIRAAVRSLLGVLAPEDEVALIAFNRSVVQLVPAARNRDRIKAALATLEAGDDTALIDATVSAMLAGESEASPSLIMVFSDGADTASFMRPETALQLAAASNVVAYAVWSGRRETPGFLRAVAHNSGGRLIDVSRSGDIAGAFLAIVSEFRQRYLITYTPTGVEPGGWHSLDVRVRRRGATVQCRKGYFGRR